ncbi:hypothetical protein B0A49_07133 [Cryomyces minteri]|uniref:Uncharacterized protein n=1 Tax=Cryomyces minteri TaxID=331657 RepID=A0A4U0WWR5_9PEZI|nr:hypothetical protein B0A49_07133 [Cryomyces minteri]
MAVQSKISGGRVASPPVGQHGEYEMTDFVHHDRSDLQSTTLGSVVDDSTSAGPPSCAQKSTSPTSATSTLSYSTNKGKDKLVESVKSSSPVSANMGSDGSEGSIHGGGTNDNRFIHNWSGRGPEDIEGLYGVQSMSPADDSCFAGVHMDVLAHAGGVAGPSNASFHHGVCDHGPLQSTVYEDVESGIPVNRNGLSTARKCVVRTLLTGIVVAVGLTLLVIFLGPKEYRETIVGGIVAVIILFIAALMVVGKSEHPLGHFALLAKLAVAAAQFVCDHLV